MMAFGLALSFLELTHGYIQFFFPLSLVFIYKTKLENDYL